MRRAEATALLAVAAIGTTSAVARLRAMASLSPPDLAFFHQATWSAARGDGFTQTALEFDAGTLFGSIHLSLIRAVWVPLYAALPAVETLIALQGIALTAGTAAAVAASRPRSHDRTPWILLAGLSPGALALGACDLRPLTFLVPAVILTAAGLVRRRPLLTGLGVLGALLAREEAWMVLAALLPLAILQRTWRGPALLIAGIASSLALPRVIWGHGGNIAANTDLPGTLDALLSGQRPWIRWPVELYFAGRVLLAAWPAVLCPELLVPALAGWAYISIFSQLEPAAPQHGGLHYLSVVVPLVLAAAAIGLGRLVDRYPTRQRTLLAAALGGLVFSIPEATTAARWVVRTLQPTPLQATVQQLRASPGGVLTISSAAPLLSGRQTLRIQGHFAPTPERITTVATEVDHALLYAERPPDGPPADEWDRWQNALPEAGLEVQAIEEGVAVWGRSPD